MNCCATSRAIAHPHEVQSSLRSSLLLTLAVVASNGCGAAEKGSATGASSQPGPSNVAGDGQQIVVRLANENEFVQQPAPESGGRRVRHLNIAHSCEKSGDLVAAYYGPVVAFARDHFVSDGREKVHAYLMPSGAPEPALADGENLVVEPRGTLGELRIIAIGPPFYAPGHRWAESVYCLHVLHEGGTTTIALDGGRFWIE